ncbi:MAG: SIMPL domain-containing protein [Deltaproteobacteria bacterium]
MRLYLTLLYIFFINLVFSQNTTIKVLGRYSYIQMPKQYVVEITLNGPDTLINRKFIALKQKLDSSVINYQMQRVYSLDQFYIKSVIQISTSDIKNITQVKNICSDLNLKFVNYFYDFYNEERENEDQIAIKAIKDAEHRADLIAKTLGAKSKRLLNIDDQVDDYHFYSDRLLITKCEKQVVEWIYELFKSEDNAVFKSSNNKSSGEYAIWVTFELIN